MWTIGVDGSLLREEITGNFIARDPDMVMASEVDLVNGTVLLSPVGELDPVELFGNFCDRSDDGETWLY
jgi:hypothetical protein